MPISRAVSLSVLSAALVLAGVTAPSTAQAVRPARDAAPAAFQKSSASPTSAFLRVDGGTAYAKKIEKDRYRITLPKGTDITWLGEAGGKSDQWGTFTPTKLTKAWTRIGHRAGVGVQSTITWRAAGTDYTSFVDARVSDPRINRDGMLVFTARTVRGALPKMLPDFSFNISSTQERPRKYPYVWGIWLITNVLGFKPSATGDASATLDWSYLNSPNNWKSCSGFYSVPVLNLSPTSLPVGATQGNVAYNGFSCNDITILSGPGTYVAWAPMQPGGRTSMLPCWTVKLNSTTSLPACNSQAFSWAAGPSSVSPG